MEAKRLRGSRASSLPVMDAQVQQMLQQLNARLDDQAQRTQQSEARAGAAEQALQAARLEIAQLQGQTAQQQATMPAMLAALGQAAQRQGGSANHTLIDARGLGRPTSFDEKEDKFPGWRRRFENFVVGSYGESFREVLAWTTECEEVITSSSWDSEFGIGSDRDLANQTVPADLDTKVNQLYAILVSLTEDDSNDIVIGAGDGNGLEAYRLLCRRWDPNLSCRKGNMLKAIIAPPRCKYEDLQGTLERWKEQIRRYERRKDDSGQSRKLDADIKLSALEMMVPTDIENHLTLNKYRLKSFDEAMKEVAFILEARTGSRLKEPSVRSPGASHGSGAQPMDVDALGYQGGGKGGGRSRGKGKDDKGGKGGRKGSQGQGGRSGGGKPQQKPVKFDGECNHCHKYGHKAADCYSKAKDDAKGGRKGGQEGGKARGGRDRKGKHGANAFEEEQWEPEAAAALDMGSFDCAGDGSVAMAPLEAQTPGKEDWIKCNLDSGCALTAFPRSFGKGDGRGNGSTYKTASGELMKDEGGLRLTASDEHNVARSLKGRVADIHKPLVAPSQCAKAGQRTYLDEKGGWMFAHDGKVGKQIEKLLAKESQQPGHGMLPIYQEKGVYNFYLKLGNGGSIAPLDEAHSTASSSDDSKLAETFSKLFAQECSKLAKQAAGPQGGRRQP